MTNMSEGVCSLCKHNRVIQCWPIEHGHGASTYNIAAAETPPGIFRQTQQHGAMVTYVCQHCGFVAWFAINPKEIPIGEAYRTSLIEGPPSNG